MTRLFIYTTPFRNAWKAMGLNDADLVQLEEILLENPQKGDVIEGTGGARKLRIQIGNHGKSGGGRVIYLCDISRCSGTGTFISPVCISQKRAE